MVSKHKYVEEGICLHVVHTLCESNAGRHVIVHK